MTQLLAANAPANAEQTRRHVVLVVMCAGYFLVLLDVTIVNVALPSIGAGLGAGVSGLQWVVDGYAIALASLMLAGGTVGDLYGHRPVVLTGLAVFGAASLGCGVAPVTGALIGCRVVQGAGAALMLPGTLAVIADAFPIAGERARAIGIWAAIGGAALPAGPLVGGALTQAVGWRAVFFVNVPIVALALVLATRTVPRTTPSGSGRLDRRGTVLGTAALALLTFAVIEAGHGGAGPAVAAAACLALAAGAAFVRVERSTAHPMFPISLLRRRDFAAANAVALAMNLATLGLLFVLTLYLQDVRGDSALIAGLALLPLFAPLSVLAPVAGRLTARIGPRRPMLAGLLVAACGVALMLASGRRSGYEVLLPALLLGGAGIGVLTPAVVAAAIGAVPGARSGLASAVNNTARQAGGAVGIAAFGALAGPPAGAGFVAGFHAAAAIAAGVFLWGAAVTAALIPASSRVAG
ncbi:MAG TPA: MFS transporter [Solirubrobacteraceae bacterium]|jgi:DHA2 family methylenomycin A resistance protein-like MFS transporter|nr:MFS transporter [Solirubrobacteraceae bacterium]